MGLRGVQVQRAVRKRRREGMWEGKVTVLNVAVGLVVS